MGHSRIDVSISILFALLAAQKATVYDLRGPIKELTRHHPPVYPALYKAMIRLQDEGLVERVGDPVSEGGRPAKQYWRVTKAGVEELTLELNEIERKAELLKALLEQYKVSHT